MCDIKVVFVNDLLSSFPVCTVVVFVFYGQKEDSTNCGQIGLRQGNFEGARQLLASKNLLHEKSNAFATSYDPRLYFRN